MYLNRSVTLNILARRSLLLILDAGLIVLAFYGAIALRLNNPADFAIFFTKQKALLIPAIISGLSVLWLSGWYRGLTRYAGSYSLYGLIPRSFLMVLLLLFISIRFYSITPPRSYWILYWFLFTGGAITLRIIMRDLLLQQIESKNSPPVRFNHLSKKPTIIYGAGASGLRLLLALRNDPRFKITGFLDDDPILHGRTLQNQVIFSPEQITFLIKRFSVQQVLLAMPSLSRSKKRYIVDNLAHLGVTVLSIPSLTQLATGSSVVSDIRSVSIEDLLGREPSIPISHLLISSIQDKVILVTGAGGSIGSEICRQITRLGVKHLIAVELNEYALFSLKNELNRQQSSVLISTVLGNVIDKGLLRYLCNKYQVNTIFHAAAYKHVPLVEENICAGVSNNVKGTISVIDSAALTSVERVMLISTDKAVRPTNIMGASKRICELLFQSAAETHSATRPIFSMVRFGNVLGSSGSVVPFFRDQIKNGGPVTVTHPSVTRYFMTIPEAVELVLQSTGMAQGGDVFLLDMGEPVKISDLARQMIELSGLRVKDTQNPDGDISIEYTGLRPGEKLYEELLISTDNFPTAHPLIRRAREPKIDSSRLHTLVNDLIVALEDWDLDRTCEIIKTLVPEYTGSMNPHE